MTKWEKELRKNGGIIWEHDEIVEHLLQIFKRDESDLLLMCALDATNRHTLMYVLDYPNCFDGKTNFGGQVIYNKKKRQFTHIQYSDKQNFAVYVSIGSKVSFFAYDFWKPFRKQFPFGLSTKKLTHYLLTN